MGHELKQSTPSDVWFKNTWSYMSAPPICLHGVGKDNFTFTFSTEI
jgi:hypothetical protein